MSAETEARQLEVAAMFERHGPGFRWWAVLTVMLGTVSAIMEATVVNVALPEIIRVFHLGLGLIIPGLNAGALSLLPHGTEAAGSASINFFRQLGGALGVTLLALFLEGRERHLDALHGLQPMQEGFFLIALVYCLALIPAWMMTGRTPRPLTA